MSIDALASKQIKKLAKEGMLISHIWRNHYPKYEYSDIYLEVYGQGARSSLGTKRMITNRLKGLADLSPQEQEAVIEEIDELVSYIYNRYKESQKKLDKIRDVIERGDV